MALGHSSKMSQHSFPSETCVNHPVNDGNGKVRFPSNPENTALRQGAQSLVHSVAPGASPAPGMRASWAT